MAADIQGESHDAHVLEVAYTIIGRVAPIMGLLKDIGVEAIYAAIEAAHGEVDERERVMLDLFQSVVGLVEVFDEGEARMTVANGEDDADASGS